MSTLCAQYAQAMASSGGAGLLAEMTDLVRARSLESRLVLCLLVQTHFARRDMGLQLEDVLLLLLYMYSALDVR